MPHALTLGLRNYLDLKQAFLTFGRAFGGDDRGRQESEMGVFFPMAPVLFCGFEGEPRERFFNSPPQNKKKGKETETRTESVFF